jgi:SAM-dependent methyltransferase
LTTKSSGAYLGAQKSFTLNRYRGLMQNQESGFFPLSPGDFMAKVSSEEIKAHYEFEKILSKKLKEAPKEQRKHLYTSLYDELFRRFPYIITEQKDNSQYQENLLKRFLSKDKTFLEVGPGAGKLLRRVVPLVKKAFALDVSNEITKKIEGDSGIKVIISDGSNIPLEDESVDVIYSNQLMEHIHPDDALEQLKNIFRVLTKGGAYVCVTPSRLSGPHDISRNFDDVATGFHLKEYTVHDLRNLFLKVGFSNVKLLVGYGIYVPFPVWTALLLENLLEKLPHRAAKWLGRFYPVRILLGVKIIGYK